MLAVVTLLLSAVFLSESQDTISVAVVCAERGISVSRADTIPAGNSHSITDLLLQSPGLVLADNGGSAGLKTVSLRGLGSPHTSIYIDGVKVGNVQTGQPDLGMLGLENFGSAVIDYAQNSVNFSTARPKFQNRREAGRIAVSGGSFGTYMPQGRFDFRISDNLALSVNASLLSSEGNYRYGIGGQRRVNNDIRRTRAGLDLFGFAGSCDWMAKLYFNGSDRGTPGSLEWPSADRQRDRNFFVQGYFRKDISSLYSINVSSKVSYDYIRYSGEWSDSDYGQTEFQLNAVHKFRINRMIDVSAVTELCRDWLSATEYDASRTGITAIAGSAFRMDRLRVDLTIQYEGIFDGGGVCCNAVSPSADARFSISDDLDMTGFVRRAYRAPTFNELYYPNYGNPDLKPENAWLADMGIDFRKKIGNRWTVRAKLDGFFNHLTNKITSAPDPADPGRWLPYNIGEVRSVGMDAEGSVTLISGGWKTGLKTGYSFQDAGDVPYISKHTTLASANASFRGWTLDVIWNFRSGRRDSYGPMPDWNTLDILFMKTWDMRDSILLTAKIECRNLTDCRYELVTGYPMPGRSMMLGMEMKF